MIELLKIAICLTVLAVVFAAITKILRAYLFEIPTKIQSLEKDIISLTARNINLNTSNESLKEKILSLNSNANSLTSRLMEQSDEIYRLKLSNQKYQEVFDKFSKDIEPLKDNQNDLHPV